MTEHAPSPRRYLVTGGFGYAGAWISEYLAALGHTVFILSRRASPPDTGFPYTLISADLAQGQPEELAGLLPDRLDGVVHAASVNEEFLADYPRKALLNNALGTRNLLAALRMRHDRQSPGRPLLVYLSTIHVYGATGGTVTEATPPLPRSDYALTHLFGEEYCRLFMRTGHFPAVIARLSNGYGAPKLPDSDKWHLLLNDLCKNAVERGVLTIRAHPGTPRDFLWLGDAASGIYRLLQRPDLAGNLFNLSSGQSLAIGEVAERVAAVAARVLGRPVAIRHETADTIPPPALHISNKAFVSATGMVFRNPMEEEIAAILDRLRA